MASREPKQEPADDEQPAEYDADGMQDTQAEADDLPETPKPRPRDSPPTSTESAGGGFPWHPYSMPLSDKERNQHELLETLAHYELAHWSHHVINVFECVGCVSSGGG